MIGAAAAGDAAAGLRSSLGDSGARLVRLRKGVMEKADFSPGRVDARRSSKDPPLLPLPATQSGVPMDSQASIWLADRFRGFFALSPAAGAEGRAAASAADVCACWSCVRASLS